MFTNAGTKGRIRRIQIIIKSVVPSGSFKAAGKVIEEVSRKDGMAVLSVVVMVPILSLETP